MSLIRPFHIAYREGPGMGQVFGDKIPKLVDQLEIYGTGLENTGDFRDGGPLITPLDHEGGIVLCWVRGDSQTRSNAWEAWGLVAPSVEDIKTWPSHWEEMKSTPSDESLRLFAERLKKGWGKSLPPQPDALPLMLTKVHRDNISEGRIIKFRVPIFQKDDIGTLAWLWLLGPIPWTSATVGPPHRMPVASVIAPSYEGIIVNAPRSEKEAGVSSFIEDLLALVLSGDIGSAEKKIELFRQQNVDGRRAILGCASASTLGRGAVRVPPQPRPNEEKPRKWITFRPAHPFKPKGESTINEKSESKAPPLLLMPQEDRLRAMESKINALLLVALMFFMVDAIDRAGFIFHKKKEVDNPPPPPSGQAPAISIPPEGTKEKGVTFDQGTLNNMHGRLIGRLSLTASPGLQSLDLSRVREADLRKRLAHVATQIRLSEIGLSEPKCKPASSLIDGDIGRRTQALITACNNQDVNSIAQSEDAALKWLHAWLGLAPTP